MKKEIKKAYSATFYPGEYGQCEFTAYAETHGKAKSDIKKQAEHHYCVKFKYADLNFPSVRRDKEYDKVLYAGEWMHQYEIESSKAKEKREQWLESILKDDNIVYCYKFRHGSYYAPDNCGYTSRKVHAGIYTKQDAVNFCKSVPDGDLQVIDIEEHNDMINLEIERLSENKI